MANRMGRNCSLSRATTRPAKSPQLAALGPSFHTGAKTPQVAASRSNAKCEIVATLPIFRDAYCESGWMSRLSGLLRNWSRN